MTAELPILPSRVSAFQSLDAPALEDLSRCVHCGLCLMNCPTFVATGAEPESPRGRLYLLRAAAEGRVELTETALPHLAQCLQCRNCEAVCPSGVPFGRIMEGARAEVFERRLEPARARLPRTLALRGLLPHRGRLAAAAALLRLYQGSGLQRAVRSGPLRHLLPPPLRRLEALAPAVSARPFSSPIAPGAMSGRHVTRVALFAGCIMPFTHAQTHRATARVLERLGYEVVAPVGGCCGALMAHAGDREAARRLARQTIDRFLALDVAAIVVNAAGCGSTMKEYGHLLERDPAYREKARRFVALVKDATEFVAQQQFAESLGAIDARVTYQDSCHLAHAQRITHAPRHIIQAIPGVRFVEMAHPDRCCGSAGIYNITQPELSATILDAKMDGVAEVDPEIIVTANPGCMMQLEAGVRQRGGTARVMHVMELLDLAGRLGRRSALTPDENGRSPD